MIEMGIVFLDVAHPSFGWFLTVKIKVLVSFLSVHNFYVSENLEPHPPGSLKCQSMRGPNDRNTEKGTQLINNRKCFIFDVFI